LGSPSAFLILQLRILSGKMAGATWAARHFPVRVGRAPSSDLQSDEEGVWNEHLTLDFSPTEGFLVQACPDALVSLNGERIERSVLRNGDVLALGALQLQFWLPETRQRSLRLREALMWLIIAAVSLVQVGLIYWLLRS